MPDKFFSCANLVKLTTVHSSPRRAKASLPFPPSLHAGDLLETRFNPTYLLRPHCVPSCHKGLTPEGGTSSNKYAHEQTLCKRRGGCPGSSKERGRASPALGDEERPHGQR